MLGPRYPGRCFVKSLCITDDIVYNNCSIENISVSIDIYSCTNNIIWPLDNRHNAYAHYRMEFIANNAHAVTCSAFSGVASSTPNLSAGRPSHLTRSISQLPCRQNAFALCPHCCGTEGTRALAPCRGKGCQRYRTVSLCLSNRQRTDKSCCWSFSQQGLTGG